MRIWIRVLVLLAMLLSVANAQCLARCATELCQTPVPACHEDPDSAPCPHPHFALPGAAATAHVTLEIAEMRVPPAFIVSVLNPAQPPTAISGDPPGTSPPGFGVLKI